jgi:hypothetical protein
MALSSFQERKNERIEIVVTRTKAQREYCRIVYMRIIRCAVVITEGYAGGTQETCFLYFGCWLCKTDWRGVSCLGLLGGSKRLKREEVTYKFLAFSSS